MDDCNRSLTVLRQAPGFVQIPLWTIVTAASFDLGIKCIVQIPLWTIVTRPFTKEIVMLYCSDSSMDDCNFKSNLNSIVAVVFRFLYGRL